MGQPSTQFLPVQIGTAENFAKQTVFSTGSRGFRATFKSVMTVGEEDGQPDLREYQVSVLVTEIGSKGSEPVPEKKSAKESGLANGGAPRVAKS
jgi:hypothetical protein